MKKTCCVFTVILCIGVLLCGCRKTVDGLSAGTYYVQGKYEEGYQPKISFDLEENSFVLNYDPLSSYFTEGSININDGKVTATTSDGKYTYIFKITDNDTICFIQEGSAEITTVEGKSPVVDGTEFKFVD